MLDEDKIKEAIGIQSVDVRITQIDKTDPLTIEAGVTTRGRVLLDPYLLDKLICNEDALISTIARKLRDDILHELFTILEEADAPDLQMIKSIARREGATGVYHE